MKYTLRWGHYSLWGLLVYFNSYPGVCGPILQRISVFTAVLSETQLKPALEKREFLDRVGLRHREIQDKGFHRPPTPPVPASRSASLSRATRANPHPRTHSYNQKLKTCDWLSLVMWPLLTQSECPSRWGPPIGQPRSSGYGDPRRGSWRMPPEQPETVATTQQNFLLITDLFSPLEFC